MTKKEFRTTQLYRLKQAQFTTKIESLALTQLLLAHPTFKSAKSIGITYSGALEVETSLIIQAAWRKGKRVYLSKTLPNRQMAFIEHTAKDELVLSSFGVPEPRYEERRVNNEVDLMIVPGIGFATDSHYRIGFGGGYYDRFLAHYPGQTVALVPTAMQFATAEWQIEPFDIPIQELILA